MHTEQAQQGFTRLSYQEVKHGNERYVINEQTPLMTAQASALHQLFAEGFIKEHALSCIAKGGRGQTLIFEIEGTQLGLQQRPEGQSLTEQSTYHWCYRQYLRGGLVGKVITDSFFKYGAQAHRAVDEFKMLMKLRLLGLPVPRPIVACERIGLLAIKNEIIIEEIQGTSNLAEILSERELSEAELSSIGQTLYHFFKFNVVHTDLNLRNILLDGDGNCYVIDFDKCRFEENGFNSVMQVTKMLARLERSFNKAQELGHIKYYTGEMSQQIKQSCMGLLASFFENTEAMLKVDLINRPAEALVDPDLATIQAVILSK